MMAASSMGPNFGGGHPAGIGHPAVAGHTMGPGMPHNPAQQGAPGGGMPHQFAGGHMAVSAPGGQVNPALMGAMPPGANPHHALQHMNPQQQQQLLQQQHFQQQFNNSPQAMAAMRQQQQLLQHQQARQVMMAQQFHNMQAAGGMPMNMQQMNPQHLHQLRQQGRIPSQHPQAQALMAQQFAMHQQQQQQQHQQQQQQQQAQAQVQAAQQQAAQQQQQQAAQQQQQQQAAQQQQQQQPQPQPQQQPPQHGQQQGPQPQPGQPAGQPVPMTAQNLQNMQQQQSQAAGGQNQMGQQAQGQQGQPGQQGPQTPQAQSQAQPQPQQPGGQQPHQTPQPSQAGTPAPTGQQTPAQTPGSTPAQPPNTQAPPAQAQVQQHQPQPQPPQGQMGQTPMHPVAAQQIAFMQQQRREGMRSQCLVKLVQFSEHLSGYPGPRGKDDLSYWNAFVARFFSQNGVFRHSLHITDTDDSADKQYEIAFPAIARYFHTNFSSGVKTMQLTLDKGTTDRALPGDCHCIENQKASLVYWFETGSHLVATGTLRAQFDAEQKLELLEFFTTGHDEYLSRRQVIEAAKPAHNWMKEWRTVNSQDSKGQSPEMSKKGKGRQLKSPQSHPPEVLSDLPDSAVNSKGVTEAVHQFLEIVEVMGQMNPLFGFYHTNPGMGPYAALEQYVSQHINNIPTAAPVMNGQPGPQNPRTPSFGQFQMGGPSPNPAHMALPGSPHVAAGSPAPGQMHSPAMQLQASQQGTSSSGPSANTSPASNKRRRPSGVKTEDDGAPTPGPQVNGIQNRGKPATPRMAKRVKGNPS